LSTLNKDQIASAAPGSQGAPTAEYREYLREAQRSEAGCPAREVVLDQRGQATSGLSTRTLASPDGCIPIYRSGYSFGTFDRPVRRHPTIAPTTPPIGATIIIAGSPHRLDSGQNQSHAAFILPGSGREAVRASAVNRDAEHSRLARDPLCPARVKLSACFSAPRERASAAVARMQTAQQARPWHECVTVHTRFGTLGGVRTSDLHSRVPATYESPVARLLIAGTPISCSTDLSERLRHAVEVEWEEAVACLEGLDGPFAAVMWHDALRRLTIVTDILGMQPLYFHRQPGVFALSSEVRALTSSGVCPASPDLGGWGAFLSFGHTIADRTLVADVRRVAPGSVLVYQADTDTLSASTYWSWPSARLTAVGDSTIDTLGDQMVAEVRACLAYHPRPVVCLSGGYDSRLILAALDDLGHRPAVLTLAHPDEQQNLDGKLALRVARAFNVSVDRRVPRPDFFSTSDYLDYVRASGLASPSLYLFIAQLSSCLRTGVEAVWDGIFPGCALFPVHQHPGGFDAYLRHAARTDTALWTAARQLFRPDVATAMEEAFLETLSIERAQYAEDESGVSQFVVRNRTRHRIAANPLQAFSNDVIPLAPGLSKLFWEMAAAIPTEMKSKHQLYRALFKRRFPKALEAPAVSGGTIDQFSRRLDWDVIAGRLADCLQRRPWLASLLPRGRLGASPFWTRSAFLDQSPASHDSQDALLKVDAVERLREQSAPSDEGVEKQRELLFYWRMQWQ
jgi:Glutamine amidotransferase domain